jgi:hypothetical protein
MGNDITTYDANINTTVLSIGTKQMAPFKVYWANSDLPLFEPSYAMALASRLKIDFTPTAALSSRDLT